MTSNLYGYADVGSMGLTHSLVAWARCRIWCDEHGATMLAPQWPRLRGRVGPRLRKEYDNRQYNGLFCFSGYVRGLRRAILLQWLKRCNSDDFQDNASTNKINDAKLIVFQNLASGNDQKYFPLLVGHGKRISDELNRVTLPQYRPPQLSIPHVAVHVRTGDFLELTHEELIRGKANGRLPLSWYANIVSSLRERIGDFAAVVYSDGKDEVLRPLLSIPNVTRSRKQPSISDLLSIAQSKLVVSSSSGFGAWGAYLGDSPRISYPGQMLEPVLENNLDFTREPECLSANELSESFIGLVKARLQIPPSPVC